MRQTITLIALLLCSFAHGSVINGTMNPGIYSLQSTMEAVYDLNNDGLFDFKVKLVDTGTGYTLSYIGLNGTQFETDGSSSLLGYNSGTPLGNGTYADSAVCSAIYFPLSTMKFVGLKFKINGIYHCAYVGTRYDSSAQTIWSLHNFGYETDQNLCITTNANGQVGFEELNSNQDDLIMVFPNPTTGKIHIQSSLALSKLSILDVNGQVLKEFEFPSTQEIVDLNSLKTGIYFVCAITDDNSRSVFRIQLNN